MRDTATRSNVKKPAAASAGRGRAAASSAGAPAGKGESKSGEGKTGESKGQAKKGSQSPSGLNKVYIDLLRDTYSAETQLVKALPKLAKAASDAELAKSLKEHLEVTQGHVERLRTIFEDLGERPGGQPCEALEGLVEEGGEAIEDNDKGPVRDAAMIVAAQKVEHYEIAAYGSLTAFARILGKEKHLDLLEQTLGEEREADETLTRVASENVNPGAAAMSEDESDDAAE